MTILYGIANCDSVKTARQWLEARHIAYEFADFKRRPPDAALLRSWIDQHPAAALLNKRSSTWRTLDAAQQAQAAEDGGALALMLRYPTLIKRPVLAHQGRIVIGFSPEHYQKLFATYE